jgi:hypothetical protein
MPVEDMGEQQLKNIAARCGCIGWRRTEAPRLQGDLRHCRSSIRYISAAIAEAKEAADP